MGNILLPWSCHPHSIDYTRISIVLKIVLFYYLIPNIVEAGNGISSEPVVIVISFDGFRYDYFQRVNAKHMNYLSKHGVSVPFMMNQFVTKTFTNHQSIATGLHPESHGVVDNVVFDPLFNKTMGENDGEDYWKFNDDILPLWTLNELAGGAKRSGSMMWPGSNHPYGKNKTVPSKVEGWNDSIAWEWRVDTVIDWLTDSEDPVNLVFMYFEEPDEFAHGFGPESPQVTNQIMRADNITGYLINKLKEHNMFEQVNMILLSDHGFLEVQQKNIINISSVVDPSLYHQYGKSPVVQIHPKDEGMTDEIYQKFKQESLKNKHFSVYKKSELPSQWHYQNNRRIMPILLVADVEYVFDDFYEDIKWHNDKYNLTANASRVYGTHGYDNKELSMHAFFLAHGPLFLHGVKVEPFDNIDLFPLICRMLGIPTPPNNGSITHVRILELKREFSFQSPVGWVFGAAIIFGLTILFGILSMMIARRRNQSSFASAESGHGGYRFVNKEEMMEILEDDDEEVDISRYRSETGNILSVRSENAADNLKQETFDGDADEIQALLLSSSNEEL